MSQISRAGFGAIAISLTLGAAQFASGHDLTAGLGADLGTASTGSQTGINRAAKVDRVTSTATSSAAPTRTISIRLDSLADTSVLIRIPMVPEARNVPPTPVLSESGDRKLTVACEPMVSTLTEVARLLQPGRCVT
jgi:hypothetical protein